MFIGREDDLKLLQGLFDKNTSSLALCRGRRRIGKSTLIKEFGKTARRFLEFQGLPPRDGITKQDQLNAFSAQLAAQTSLPKMQLESWSQAFTLLASQIRKENTVLLLDEISWLGRGEKDFAGLLKIAWDKEFKNHQKLVMVLCGSVSSWIDKNILNNTGFVGRISADIHLKPLSLYHCNLFWRKKGNRISSLEKLKVLSVTGGIPKYLEEMKVSLDAEQNIKELCFRSQGPLFMEFDQIFHAIFGRRAATYAQILRSLVSGKKSLEEICMSIGKDRSGNMSGYLADLEMSGFICRDIVYKHDTAEVSRLHKYRLCDNYVRFYLHYVQPIKERITQGIYHHASLEDIVRWDVILGLQFENVVLGNLTILFRLLDIDPGRIRSASPYFQRRTNRQQACQIDLLIQTNRTIFLCEMKCRKSIGTEAIDEMQKKVLALNPPKGQSVRTALIHEGECSRALLKEGYFDHVIPFHDMLYTAP